MIRKLLVTGAMGLLAVSAWTTPAAAQFAPVPTTPTSAPTAPTTTSTTEPRTTVQRSTEVATTGPRDRIGLLSLAGVVLFAVGVSLRGRRATGVHWRDG